MLTRYLALITLCLYAASGYSQQNIDIIKSSPQYLWSEGIGTTFQEADADALKKLGSQIWTHISAETKRETETGTSNNGTINETTKGEYFVKTFTAVSIPNARAIELAPAPNCKVFRYVSLSDINKIQQLKSDRIIDLVETGKRAEAKLQIDDALRNYYWALMLASSHTKRVTVDFAGESKDCIFGLHDKIISVLNNISAKLIDCQEENGTYLAKMKFTYGGKDVASIQLKYHNGLGFIGPLYVRDGIGEFDLARLPDNGKLRIAYEYYFRDEASTLNPELKAVFDNVKVPVNINSTRDIPVKVNKKKGTMSLDEKKLKKEEQALSASTDSSLAPEPVTERDRIELEQVDDNAAYLAIMPHVETAITAGNPEIAKNCFSHEGYELFLKLFTKIPKIKLVGKPKYEFIKTSNQVLARFCNVKIKYADGRTFMEKIVFRFNPISKKIQSLAFALTKKAEDDIFNSASPWGEVSRHTILQFMEDYQSAFMLQRLDFIKQIFSDDAIIIVGSVVPQRTKGMYQDVSAKFARNKKVRYSKLNRDQYLNNLKKHFNQPGNYYHLSFEDNTTGRVNTQNLFENKDAAFVIQIRQFFNSRYYSDIGYLTLFLNMLGKHPIIEVRLWQPEGDEMSYSEFLKLFFVK